MITLFNVLLAALAVVLPFKLISLSLFIILIFTFLLEILYARMSAWNPARLQNKIYLGDSLKNESAEGWLFTVGLRGIKRITGSFYGKIAADVGVWGFSGLRIGALRNRGLGKYFYLGTALVVNVGGEAS
jgi:hypothetical protein